MQDVSYSWIPVLGFMVSAAQRKDVCSSSSIYIRNLISQGGMHIRKWFSDTK